LHNPIWSVFEAVAPTLAYDHTALLGDDAAVPVEKAARVTVPALVMAGDASYPFMLETAVTLATAIPNASYITLEGQTHEVSAEVLAPVLIRFFTH
jgi:pimeloyl-ACP methyl ester carboxylesterase